MNKIFIISLIIVLVIVSLLLGILSYRFYKNFEIKIIPKYGEPKPEILEVARGCQNWRLGSEEEWELMGFLVNGDVASGEATIKLISGKETKKVEFNISEKQVCFDILDCEKECKSVGLSGRHTTIRKGFIDGVLSCGCIK